MQENTSSGENADLLGRFKDNINQSDNIAYNSSRKQNTPMDPERKKKIVKIGIIVGIVVVVAVIITLIVVFTTGGSNNPDTPSG
jgi:hypothetical protein